jgi:uncharacterized membrane protein
MSGLNAFLIVITLSLITGLISGLVVRKWGYSFGRYFVTGFIAASGVLGIIYKILIDYL